MEFSCHCIPPCDYTSGSIILTDMGHPTSHLHFLCNLPPFHSCFIWNLSAAAFSLLILPRGISMDWSKHYALFSNICECQRQGPNLGFLHRGCYVPGCWYQETPKNFLIVPDIFILKEFLAKDILDKQNLSRFTLLFVVLKLILR